MRSADEIIRVFCEVSDFRTMKTLFSELFTPAEIQDVALRWRLMGMLHEQVSQRTISSELGVSLCKITRGSKILRNPRSVSKKILDNSTGGRYAAATPAKQGPG